MKGFTKKYKFATTAGARTNTIREQKSSTTARNTLINKAYSNQKAMRAYLKDTTWMEFAGAGTNHIIFYSINF